MGDLEGGEEEEEEEKRRRHWWCGGEESHEVERCLCLEIWCSVRVCRLYIDLLSLYKSMYFFTSFCWFEFY